MCAAAYLDRSFRDKVIGDVYCDRNRRVAPSYGFDLVVVVRHAWRAWRLDLCQNLILLATLAVALIEAPLKALIAAEVLAIWHLTSTLLRLAADFGSYYRGSGSFIDLETMKSRGSVLVRALLGLCIACAGTVSWEWRMNAFKHESWPIRSGAVGAGFIFALVIVTIGTTNGINRAMLGGLRKSDGRGSAPRPGRLATIRAQERHPIVVYSGYRPFIGSGLSVRTWSFAQRLIYKKTTDAEPDRDFEKLPFAAENLIQKLRERITALNTEENPEMQLPGLTVKDCVFVEGTHAIGFMPALAERPDSQPVKAQIDSVIANSGEVARHYLACEVDAWGGEVITTVFVHVSLQGRTLYIQFATYALLPTREPYHAVDAFGGTGPWAVVRAGVSSVAELSDVFMAPRRLLTAMAQIGGAVRARRDGTLKPRRGVDIGAKISMRETVATVTDQSYFQIRDIEQHWKIIERRLIATVGDFLLDHNVDTSEFLERAKTILNNGVMVSGQGINISGSAIGADASVTTGGGQATGDAAADK